jgi:hypothetical protein
LADIVLSGEFMGVDVGYMFDDSNRIVPSGLLDSGHIVVTFCGMHDGAGECHHSRGVDSEHGFIQYIPQRGGVLPRELDRLITRHPRSPEQRLAWHVYNKQDIMHVALPLWKRGLLRCISLMPEYVLRAMVQLIATASSSLVVFLHLFVFRPLLAPYIESYYVLVWAAWLLAFSPVIVGIG